MNALQPIAAEPVLRVEDLVKTYGAFRATDGVSLRLQPGERRAVIGPNGAGKSTLFNLVAGSLKPTAGRLWLGDSEITRSPEHHRSRLGLARTYQHSNLFTSLSCVDNVALVVRRVAGIGTALRMSRHQRIDVRDRAMSALAQVMLQDRAADSVSSLSHGERRQLEVAMALASDPRILLFDEPTAGMSVLESHRFTELISELPRELTVLIIEHDLEVVFALADNITVLVTGSILEEGSPEQIRSSAAVEEAYLGSGHDEVFITA